MKQTMKMLRISRPVKAQIRNSKPLTEKEEYLTEVLEDHLKNFQQKSYLFGLFNTYKWTAEQPKTSVRMLLWNFDSANGTQYLRQIFGDDPIPDFIMQNSSLRDRLCLVIVSNIEMNARDLDELELAFRIEEKFGF